MAWEPPQPQQVMYYVLQPAPKQIYCRLCLSNSLTSKYKQIFSPFNEIKSVAQTIVDFAQVEILETDDYSKLICFNCLDKLTATEQFKVLIQNSDFQIKNEASPGEPTSSSSILIKDEKDQIEFEDVELQNNLLIKKEIKLEPIEDCPEFETVTIKMEDVKEEKINKKPISCPKCHETFTNFKTRKEHTEICCMDFNRYTCSICNKAFANKNNRDVHERGHSDVRPFQCEICGKSFKYVQSLEHHKFIHTATRLFKCDQCNKTFRTRNYLNKHKITHSEDAPLECNFCPRRYKSDLQLRVHVKQIHNPLLTPCEICGKSVRCLSAHIKTHTKPYKCDTCGQGFGYKRDLNYHLPIHKKEQVYTCDVCQKGFSHPSSLRSHKKLNHSEVKFGCKLCSKEFCYNYHLQKHLKTAHKNKTL